jgi:8-oxo-dGTP diphosphatase
MIGRVVKGAVEIAWSALRLLLRRPILGALAVAVDDDGRIVLIRRHDTGTWGLPGGMVDYGERVYETLGREIHEETGYRLREVTRIVGVYSEPDRDPRAHSVCVLVAARVEAAPAAGDLDHLVNPLETLEVRAFPPDALPAELAYDTRRMLDDFAAGKAAVLS